MRRLTAWLLAIVMVTTISDIAYANEQDPVKRFTVDDVSYALSTDYVTGDSVINPTIDLSWEDPESWNLDGDYHVPDYYNIGVTNITLDTTESLDYYKESDAYTSKTLELHNEMQLETGSLYELDMIPYHKHTTYDDAGNATTSLAPLTAGSTRVYALTDVETEFISGSEEIQVIWDDIGIPSFNYRIAYALGEYDTKDELLDNSEGTLLVKSTSDGVTAYEDLAAQRDKLSYTIDTNIIPGQSYSVMVEPIVDDYNGYSVQRNRYYPNITNVATSVELFLEEEGENIRLVWEIPTSYLIDGNTSTLSEIRILEYENGSPSTVAIFNGLAGAIGYYKLSKPTTERSYQLEITYTNQSQPTASNTVTYSPLDYFIKPTRPEIPLLLTSDILKGLLPSYSETDDILDLDDTLEKLEEDYLVENYQYDGAIATIMDEDVTFHIEEGDGFNLVWGAFERLDVTTGSKIYDNNIYYDIYVTDAYSALSYMTPTYEDIYYSSTLDDGALVNTDADTGDEEIVGYRQTLSQYYQAPTETSLGSVTDILPGKLYYISIRAKKVTGRGTLISDANTVAVYYDDDGDAYQPPSIVKPPFREKVSETTEDGVTVQWSESWFEIIAEEAPSSHILSDWQHELWMDDDGKLSTESIDDLEPYRIYDKFYRGVNEIERFKEAYKVIEPDYTIREREVNLSNEVYGASDIEYKFLYLRYDDVLKTINERSSDSAYGSSYSFDAYIQDLMAEDQAGTEVLAWTDIEPYTDVDDDTYLAYRQEGLRENTSYVFLLLPYRTLVNGETLSAHYPSTLIVSTDPVQTEVTPDPTVPNLYADSLTDASIQVEWKYNTDFTYELKYSRDDDVDGAISVPVVLPDVSDATYPEDGQYYPVVVDDLFPLTTYYFWIRASQVATNTTSSWSNPVSEMTKDVTSPVPPRGLGLLPDSEAATYGYDASVSEDYMIIEWLKDLGDTEAVGDAKVQKTYTYVVEVSENAKFIDPIYVESSGGVADIIPDGVEVLEKNILKFNDLIGNRHYYVRAKTRLVVEGSEDGQYLTKDSISYTSPIRILTLSTGNEYDGEIDPALTILPEDDYELVYDSAKDLLEFRFRSNDQDDDGASDNSVDQRLISSLIKEKATTYDIDLMSYKNKDIDQRRITMPYSIVEAFDDYGIDLVVKTESLNLTIPSDSLAESAYEQVDNFGVAPSIVIDITDMTASEVSKHLPDSGLQALATPQEIKVTVVSDRHANQVFYADAPIEVAMPVSQWYGLDDAQIVVYGEDSRGDWSKLESDYNKNTHMVTFETAKLGGLGVYAYNRTQNVVGSNTAVNHWSEAARKEVYSQFTVKGNDAYNAEASVTEKAVGQAVYNAVLGNTVVDINQSLTSSQIQTLIRADITGDTDLRSGTIDRQAAISMFVRAYELVEGTTIDVSQSTLDQVKKVSGLNSSYEVRLAKAVEEGLISDVSDIRPTEKLKYGEYFTLWSRLLD